jgi:hypothetical protein
MRRWLAVSIALLLAVACEPSTNGVNINSPTPPVFAQVRVFDFLTDLPTSDSIVSVVNQLPVAFSGLTAPAVTGFQQEATGTWTAYVSVDETSIAMSAAYTADVQGDLYTVVETGVTAAGGTPAPAFTWVHEVFPAASSGEAQVRFVLGAPAAVGATISLGSSTLTSSAVLGQPTDWLAVAPTASSVSVDTSGTTTMFTITPPAAGSFHTYAVAVLPSSSKPVLLDVTEVPGGSSTSTLISSTGP